MCVWRRKWMRLCIRDVGVVVLVFVFVGLNTQLSFAQEPPLVDGDCDEYPRLQAKRISVSKDVELHLYQDKDQHSIQPGTTHPQHNPQDQRSQWSPALDQAGTTQT